MLVVIPVSEGETHTAFHIGIGQYVEGQEGITIDQLTALGRLDDINDDIRGMSPFERYVWLVEVLEYYTFTSLAIVDESKLEMLERVIADLDWSDGNAIEMFNTVVIASAQKTIPFYNDNIIQVDPNY